MKAAIVYDTYYGNTKTVAETIAAELEAEGHEAQLISLQDKPMPPPQGDILFLGSPVRFGSATKRAKQFTQKLDRNIWKDKPIIVFTTILASPENPTDKQKESREKYDIAAGYKLVELARSQGLNALENHLWVDVKGRKGPLAEAGPEEIRQFTRDVLRGLKIQT
jgi:flavodoxin